MAKLTADSQGKIRGKFRIPANVPAGSKAIVFLGKGGTRGDATFVGQGKLKTTVMKKYAPPADPLAQTFMFTRPAQVCGIDLWFTAKSGEVRVQMREVANGVPGRVVLAEKTLAPADIVVAGGGHTRVLFDAPVPCAANSEYAFVILCDDPTTKLSIAEMGKFDSRKQVWVTQQPYAIGVLLSSSNASTWTPHQEKDLTFRILEADFSSDAEFVIDLGSVDVENMTDVFLLSLSEIPDASCRCEYELEFPDGTKQVVDADQTVSFAEKISGQIKVRARLAGNAESSAILYPGIQVMAGEIATSADYYTRSISAQGAAKATLIYEAYLPSGASVKPQIQVDSGEWEDMAAAGSTRGDEDTVEFKFTKELNQNSMIKVKFVLNGTLLARPTVSNIRLLATA